MSLTYTVTQSIVNGSDNLSEQNQLTAARDIRFNTTIGVLTNSAMGLTFDYDDLVCVYMVADQNMRVEFNDSTTGVPTIDLLAGVPFVWTNASYLTNKFTADVTEMYVTTTVSTAINFRFALTP